MRLMNPAQNIKLHWLAAGLILSLPLPAAELIVDNLNDDGTGSLREAIDQANSDPAPDVIHFDASLDGTLTLASPLPAISTDIDIIGPGAQQVAISGDQTHQILMVEAGASVLLSGLALVDGTAELGGAAIINEGTLTIADSVLSGNYTKFGAGGAIENFNGDLVVLRSILSGNQANTGGGIANSNGTVQIIDSTISNNQALIGGGIDNAGQLTIVGSTISGNNADLGGGVENSDELELVNSTLSGNTAAFDGGGIDNFGGNVSLLQVTVAFNQSGGSDIWNGELGSILSKNSIVAGESGDHCHSEPGAEWSTQGVNLASSDDCEGFQSVTLTELALGELNDNEGPTWTHALDGKSIALNAAEDCTALDGVTAVEEDQRGVPRPQGPHCDVGSYERIVAIDPPPPEDPIFADRFEQIPE